MAMIESVNALERAMNPEDQLQCSNEERSCDCHDEQTELTNNDHFSSKTHPV